jgi:hypothetical protein
VDISRIEQPTVLPFSPRPVSYALRLLKLIMGFTRKVIPITKKNFYTTSRSNNAKPVE